MPRLPGPAPRLMLRPVKLVFSLLLAFAVLMAPAGMMRVNAAPAAAHDMSAASPLDHCEKSQPDKRQPPENCCVMACAALIALPAELNAPALQPAEPQALELAHLQGLPVEAATPPPRIS